MKERDERIIIKYGVIVAFKNGTPLFLHQSFAEFFLAKSSFQKIKEQIKNEKELKQILRDKRHFLIRKFLNDLMENQENPKEQQQKKRKLENDDLNQEIENCCRENLISLLKYLVEDKGANLKTENIFLIIASENGNKEIVAFLLEKEIDVNQQDEDENTALILASKQGHKEIVRMLLQDKNIEINELGLWDGYTALMWATANGHKEIVQMLNDENKKKNQKNIYGDTALMWASEEGHKEIVEMLLKDENIEINYHDDEEWTALMLASKYGHKEIVQMLLQDERIEINHHDDAYGYTALMWASSEGHKEIVRILLQHKGIDVNQHVYQQDKKIQINQLDNELGELENSEN